MTMENNQSALIAEQLKHALDLLRADLEAVEARAAHDRELTAHRLQALEELSRDHEGRLRSVGDGVTQFKVWSGLAAGGSGLMSVIAFVKAVLGGA